MIIVAIILGLIALIALIIGITRANVGVVAGGVLGLLIAVGLSILASTYTQDTGEASVVVDWTGNIQGQETSPGLHFKSPFSSVHTFSVRNQQVVFAGNGSDNNTGGAPDGPQITVQDADGVTSNVDIALRYSIRPDQVTSIYKQFKTEDNFKASFVQQDVRSAVRSAPGQYHTLTLITKRSDVEHAIQTAIEARWRGSAVTVDSVSLQEIRVPDSVKDSYAAAQKSQIRVSQAKNDLEAATVSAQRAVVEAKANAQANKELAKSLTAPVLQQHYYDTLGKLARSGNLVVVPSGSNPLVNVK